MQFEKPVAEIVGELAFKQRLFIRED